MNFDGMNPAEIFSIYDEKYGGDKKYGNISRFLAAQGMSLCYKCIKYYKVVIPDRHIKSIGRCFVCHTKIMSDYLFPQLFRRELEKLGNPELVKYILFDVKKRTKSMVVVKRKFPKYIENVKQIIGFCGELSIELSTGVFTWGSRIPIKSFLNMYRPFEREFPKFADFRWLLKARKKGDYFVYEFEWFV